MQYLALEKHPSGYHQALPSPRHWRRQLLVHCLVLATVLILVGGAWPDGKKSAELSAQRVTLVGRLTLVDALQKLSEQVEPQGNHVRDLRPDFGQPTDNPVLDLQLREATFWQACDELARLSALRLVILPPRGERDVTVGLLAPTNDKGQTPPTYYSGPFRVRITEVQAVRHFEAPALSHLAIQTEWACEPRYLPIWLRVGRESVRWRVGNSQEQLAEPTGQGTLKWLGEAALNWRLRLPLPERRMPQLDSLTLNATALVAPKRLALRLAPLVPNKSWLAEDVQVRLVLAEYEVGQQHWHFQLRLDYPAPNKQRGFDLESYHTWIMDASRFWLQSKESKLTWAPLRAPVVSVEGRHAFTVKLLFPAPEKTRPTDAQNWELGALIPADPVVVPIQATFQNVPLP